MQRPPTANRRALQFSHGNAGVPANDSAAKFRRSDIKYEVIQAIGHTAVCEGMGTRAIKMSRANREYKDSVFRDLFSTDETALDLYNALTDSRFTVGDGLRFTTLENALFMDRVNDVSFTIGDRLVVLIEHQSAVNQNVPLRALIYIGRVYEQIIDNKAIYRTKLLTIPTPEFYVLYNGRDAYPDMETLKLSDAFKRVGIPGAGGEHFQSLFPALELTVRVFNVNVGHNEKILERCEPLRGYAVFTGRIRENLKEGQSLEDAIAAAMNYCIANGILVEYLEKHGSEVRNMLFTEWKLEDAQQVWLEKVLKSAAKKAARKVLKSAF